MALETLKYAKKIGGFKVVQFDSSPVFEKDNFIYINKTTNTITFTIQNGPVKEKGVVGCQVDTIIEAAKLIISGLNEKFPCRENAKAIDHLDEAILWLKKRTWDREERGVEGTNQL